MNKPLLDERDNPKALLVPGTVPLPVHNIIKMPDSSDSEDNLPSTIDFDALKVPGLPETSFQNVMGWRGGTPRMKTKQSLAETPKKEVANATLSVVTEAESISDVLKNTEESSSDSDDSESETDSSTGSESSTGSSVSSDSSGSDSETGKSTGTDSGDKSKSGKNAKVRRKLIPRKSSLQKPKDTLSISNSSTSSHSKNRRRKSFTTVDYQPGSLKLRLSVFDAAKVKVSDMSPSTTAIPSVASKWKTARLTNGAAPPRVSLIAVNGNCDANRAKGKIITNGTDLLTKSSSVSQAIPLPTFSSSSHSSVESKRVTRQSLSRKLEDSFPPSIAKSSSPSKNDSPQKNGLVIASSKSESVLLLSPIKSKNEDQRQLFAFNNNNTFVPVGQTSQLTDSVTMTRVSAPSGPLSSDSVNNLGYANITLTMSRSHQRSGIQQEQLSDPVLYLKKSSDLTIFPISPDKTKSWTSPVSVSSSNPKVIITPTSNFPAAAVKNLASTSPSRLVRRLSSQRKSTDKSDVESWDSWDLGVNEAIKTVDSVLASEKSVMPAKVTSNSNGNYAPRNLKYGCQEVKVRLPPKLDLSIRPIANDEKEAESRVMQIKHPIPPKRSLVSESQFSQPAKSTNRCHSYPQTSRRIKARSEEAKTEDKVPVVLNAKSITPLPSPTSISRTKEKKLSNNKLSIFVTSTKSIDKLRSSNLVSKNGKKSGVIVENYPNSSISSLNFSNSEKITTNVKKAELISESKLHTLNGRVNKKIRELQPNFISGFCNRPIPLTSQVINVSGITGVRTKAAKKYIPEETALAEVIERKRAVVIENLVKLSKTNKKSKVTAELNFKKKPLAMKVLKTTTSICKLKAKKKTMGLNTQIVSDLCDRLTNKWNIEDSTATSPRRAKKAFRSNLILGKSRERFTFDTRIFKDFTLPSSFGFNSTSPPTLNKNQRSSDGSSTSSKFPGSRTGITSGSPNRRKRGTILPKCRSNTSLDGTENATDLQKLPLKKRHGHGNHHYDGPADDDGGPEDTYAFGIFTFLPTIIPPITSSSSCLAFSSKKSWPEFSDFYKVKVANDDNKPDDLESQQVPSTPRRGRPKKKTRRKHKEPPIVNPLFLNRTSGLTQNVSLESLSPPVSKVEVEMKRSTRLNTSVHPLTVRTTVNEEDIEQTQWKEVTVGPRRIRKLLKTIVKTPNRIEDSLKIEGTVSKIENTPMEIEMGVKPSSVSSLVVVDQTTGKPTVVEVDSENPDGPDVIDVDSPIELIDIADDTTGSSPDIVQALNSSTSAFSGRKKRRANRTGFPNVKKKKKKFSVFQNVNSTTAFGVSEIADFKDDQFKMGIQGTEWKIEEEEMEIDDQMTTSYIVEGFSSTLTERVKIRRRNSIDSISKEEREQIAAGIIEVPGVIPAFMDVPNPPIVLPNKENYTKSGLLSTYFKYNPAPPLLDQTLSVTELLARSHLPITKEEICPLPAYTGMKTGPVSSKEYYKLPYDIWCLAVTQTRNCFEDWARIEEDRRAEERQRKSFESKKGVFCGSPKKKKIQMPAITPDSWHFKRLRSNAYFGYTKPPATIENDQMCECKDGEFRCASDDCLNRVVFTECPPACGENCMNRRIQKHDWAPQLRRFLTEDKGYGVNSLQTIKKGDFILEYVGEVVSAAEFKQRMLEIYANDMHHYCLQLDSGRVIDGHRSGGEGRFVNHSCEPNCEMQKWSVNGLYRMALFALKDIPSEEELSYDYNFSLYNETEGQPCFCKSINCRGVIGGKSKAKDGKDGNRRKNAGRPKGIHAGVDTVHKGLLDPSVKVKVLSKKEIKYARSANIFLVRNYERIRRARHRGSDDEEIVSDRVEKLMNGWISRYKPGSTTNKQLILTGEDPKVARVARMAQIFFELCKHVTAAKDTSGKCISELFMDYPLKRVFPNFHSVIERTKVPGFKQIERNIIRGQYMSLQALEDDIRIVLTTFAQAYLPEKPDIPAQVDRIKKIYKEAKQKALLALEPFIVTPMPSTKDNRSNRVQSPSRSVNTKLQLPPFIPYEPSKDEDTVRCICGTFYEEGMMVQCEKCLVWQHCDCMRMPYDPSRADFPKNSKREKEKLRKATPKNKSEKSASPSIKNSTPERKMSIEEKEKVEFDSGELISVREELPLLEEKQGEDLSEMATQVLVPEMTEEKSVGKMIEIEDEVSDKNETPYYCELCEPRDVDPEVPMGGPDDTPDKIYFLTLRREDDLLLRKNDTVYVLRDWPPELRLLPDGTPRPRNTYTNTGPLIKEECDIFRIDSLWKDGTGNRMVMGYNYLRPHETHHEPSRRFYPNEILKAPIHEIIGIELIHGRCWVLDTPTYCKGRPKDSIEEHLYICDLRVNKTATSFDKIGKRSQMICTKPFAFNHFEMKIKINRNVHPHGPPSPDFKSRPTNIQSSGNDKTKSRKLTAQKYKSKVNLTNYEASQIAKHSLIQRENLHAVVTVLQSKIENFTSNPIDLSHLLVKEKKRKIKSYTSR